MLIVGYGPSGMDIASAIKDVACRVVVSYHSQLKTRFVPPGVQLRPNILRFGKTEVEFVDGVKEEFTDVVFCTGS